MGTTMADARALQAIQSDILDLCRAMARYRLTPIEVRPELMQSLLDDRDLLVEQVSELTRQLAAAERELARPRAHPTLMQSKPQLVPMHAVIGCGQIHSLTELARALGLECTVVYTSCYDGILDMLSGQSRQLVVAPGAMLVLAEFDKARPCFAEQLLRKALSSCASCVVVLTDDFSSLTELMLRLADSPV